MIRAAQRILPILMLLAALSPAFAQAPPVVGLPDVNFKDNVTRTVLPNGLTLLVVEDHHTDIVGIEFLFRVGQADEDSSTGGITHPSRTASSVA
jgi:hypothetical protein